MYLSINGDEKGDDHGGDSNWNVDDDDNDSDEEEKEEEDGHGDDNDGTYLPKIL